MLITCGLPAVMFVLSLGAYPNAEHARELYANHSIFICCHLSRAAVSL